MKKENIVVKKIKNSMSLGERFLMIVLKKYTYKIYQFGYREAFKIMNK